MSAPAQPEEDPITMLQYMSMHAATASFTAPSLPSASLHQWCQHALAGRHQKASRLKMKDSADA